MYSQHHIQILQLARTKNIGSKTYRHLIQRYQTPKNTIDYLVEKFGKNYVCSASTIEKELHYTTCFGANMCFLGDKNYPYVLSTIHDPPICLTIMGQQDLWHQPSLAIIGTRNASQAGQKLSQRFAKKIGEQGYIIISGLAKGIDSSAHKGSIESGTIGVIAGGINSIYPKQNKTLYDQIKTQGLLVTEAPFNAEPIATLFPRRNRIISGLSLGVLVIEASLRSGTIITANMALEQGRDVFAVPGSPLDERARGSNNLIRHGAILTKTPDDILPILEQSHHRIFGEVLPLSPTSTMPQAPMEEGTPSAPSQPQVSDTDLLKAQKILCQCLSTIPMYISELMDISKIEHHLFHQAIIECELENLIEFVPPNHYIIAPQTSSSGLIKGLF